MPEPSEHIGRRVRIARIAAGLSQGELAGLVGRSAHWIEDIEAGRLGLDRYSLIFAIAETCQVDVVWLLGQPYRLSREAGSTPHSFIPALRTVLRRASLILSNHPGLAPTSEAGDIDRMRVQATAVGRARQKASLADAASLLPGLLEKLNTALLARDRGPERTAVLTLVVDVARNARQTLNQLGYPDLAWNAAEVAAGAATQLDDPIAKAAVAWDRCGAMLHQGSMPETEAIALAALRDLEPLTSGGDEAALALQGALTLRHVIACARAGRSEDAWEHTQRALEIAGRLPAGFADLRFHTVFGRPNVQVHAAEVGVEIDQAGKGLSFVQDVHVADVPSRERLTHYKIDRARALQQMGKAAESVLTLREAAAGAPLYVYAHPMARALVEDLARKGVPPSRCRRCPLRSWSWTRRSSRSWTRHPSSLRR
ncbi:helix-turn-helix domain-containing protein [Streptomyces rubradiris]|uniref:helix-turn-helix domain-containing protein n=1 Tax=Streptomyces rubradiris TaxID=285531 RepID=UPI0036E01C09